MFPNMYPVTKQTSYKLPFVFVSPFVLAFGMVFDVFVGLLRRMYITNQRLVQICQDMNSLNGI